MRSVSTVWRGQARHSCVRGPSLVSTRRAHSRQSPGCVGSRRARRRRRRRATPQQNSPVAPTATSPSASPRVCSPAGHTTVILPQTSRHATALLLYSSHGPPPRRQGEYSRLAIVGRFAFRLHKHQKSPIRARFRDTMRYSIPWMSRLRRAPSVRLAGRRVASGRSAPRLADQYRAFVDPDASYGAASGVPGVVAAFCPQAGRVGFSTGHARVCEGTG